MACATPAIRCARTLCWSSFGLGGADAREAVLQGLETPSYREAIQNAAIAAVVQHPDPELVAGARAAARRAAAPRARAGGAHRARGYRRARGGCGGRWTTSVAWVREWMLAAVEDQLEAGDAVALLREAEPALRRPEARTEVTRAIGRLGRPPS